jgi:hypothetical protein
MMRRLVYFKENLSILKLSSEMARHWRGLYPTVDCGRLMMMMMIVIVIPILHFSMPSFYSVSLIVVAFMRRIISRI